MSLIFEMRHGAAAFQNIALASAIASGPFVVPRAQHTHFADEFPYTAPWILVRPTKVTQSLALCIIVSHAGQR